MSETLMLAPAHDGGRLTAPAVVSTAVDTLAHEFPELPLGLIIAATVRTLHELRTVPLTTLVDAQFDGVIELVEKRTRDALRARDEQRVLERVAVPTPADDIRRHCRRGGDERAEGQDARDWDLPEVRRGVARRSG